MKKLSILIILVVTSICARGQVPAYIDTAGLLAWYPFNGNANNAYSAGMNGIVLGPTLTSDRFGNPNSAYHFNGMLDHILIDTAFFNIGWSNFTISWWMNNDSLDNPNNGNNNQCSFNTIPFNGLAFDYNWGHDGKYMLLAGSVPTTFYWDILVGPTSRDSVTAHVWNHLVYQKQNDTVYSFYLNGVLDTTVTSSILATNYFCRFILGNTDSTATTEGVWGKLDDYGIWNRTLSACEIKKLFNSSAYLFITTQPVNTFVTTGANAQFSITDTGSGNTYQWQENEGAGYANLSNTGPYSGVTTPTLTVSGVAAAMTNYQYRCVVTGGAGCVDTSAGGALFVTALGVNSINKQAAITIAPNPTTGEISILGTGCVDIRVYNMIGQLVKEVFHTDNFSIAEMPAGVYSVKLFDANGALIYNGQLIRQ